MKPPSGPWPNSKYFTSTGTSAKGRFNFFTRATISELCAMPSWVITTFSAACLDKILKPLCASDKYMPVSSQLTNRLIGKIIFLFSQGTLERPSKNREPNTTAKFRSAIIFKAGAISAGLNWPSASKCTSWKALRKYLARRSIRSVEN